MDHAKFLLAGALLTIIGFVGHRVLSEGDEIGDPNSNDALRLRLVSALVTGIGLVVFGYGTTL